MPAPGTAFWYLSRADSPCAYGPYGQQTDGSPRLTTTCPLATDSFQNDILATGFTLPTKILFLPDARMLVAELVGNIKVLPPPYTTPDPTPFLELHLTSPVSRPAAGIMDVALDPDFDDNHYYFASTMKDR